MTSTSLTLFYCVVVDVGERYDCHTMQKLLQSYGCGVAVDVVEDVTEAEAVAVIEGVGVEVTQTVISGAEIEKVRLICNSFCDKTINLLKGRCLVGIVVN